MKQNRVSHISLSRTNTFRVHRWHSDTQKETMKSYRLSTESAYRIAELCNRLQHEGKAWCQLWRDGWDCAIKAPQTKLEGYMYTISYGHDLERVGDALLPYDMLRDSLRSYLGASHPGWCSTICFEPDGAFTILYNIREIKAHGFEADAWQEWFTEDLAALVGVGDPSELVG